MENTEIMSNEVMEVAEEFVPAGSGNGFKIVGGVALLVGAIYGGYKLVTKIKAKKEQKANEAKVVNFTVVGESVDEIE